MPIVYGRSWFDVYDDLVAAFPELDMGLERMQAELDAFFYAARDRADVRIPGSVALLRKLAKTTPCCIVSGSPCEHIADAIVYAINQPWGVSLGEITVRAAGDHFIL